MHIVLGILGSIVTILYMLDRLGIDLGGLNPFYYFRRRRFAKRYGADPIYSVEDPVHVASLLIIGAAKLDGDLTAEQKDSAQKLFESEFSMSPKEAQQLFGSAAHLLAAPQLLDEQLAKFAERNASSFSTEQAESLVRMMSEVASSGGSLSASQEDFIQRVRASYVRNETTSGPWG